MNCQFCGEPMEDDAVVCPACGQPVEQAQEEMNEEPLEAAEEITEETEEAAETAEETPAKDGEQKKNVIYGVLIAVLVVVIAFLAVRIFKDKNAPEEAAEASETVEAAEEAEATEGTEVTEATDSTTQSEPSGNGISYTVTEDQLTEDVLNTVIVTCGEDVLTNRELPLYYWQQYYTFVNTYSSYITYLLDTSLGLDEQMYSEELTWQQAFLQQAENLFIHVAAVAQEAEKAGFELPEDVEESFEASMVSLAESAKEYGIDSIGDYLVKAYGPTVTEAIYRNYVRQNLMASSYLQMLVNNEGCTDEDVSNYYDENAETYASQGIDKVDSPMIDIRHILIVPTETDEDGNYTEAAWAEAEKKAQDILDQWLSGEATEASFADLVADNSDDSGSSAVGGLYEDVYPGRMVEEFDSWCFEEGRKPGDYGIVKTSYGYHIMYFSAVGEEIYWYETAKADYLAARSAALETDIVSRYEATVTDEKAAFVDKFLSE